MKRNKFTGIGGLGVVALIGLASCGAETKVGERTGIVAEDRVPAGGETQALEIEVLTKLHQGNHHEIGMAELARERGSERVKKFAEQLIQDHKAADQRVVERARQIGQELGPAEGHSEMIHRLEGLQGAEFDRAFAQVMIEDHHREIEELKAIQQRLASTDTGRLLAELLPTLQSHLDTARSLLNENDSGIPDNTGNTGEKKVEGEKGKPSQQQQQQQGKPEEKTGKPQLGDDHGTHRPGSEPRPETVERPEIAN